MIPRTGACARSWPTALSRSSRPTLPTKRSVVDHEDAALAMALAERHRVTDARAGRDGACGRRHDVSRGAVPARRRRERVDHPRARRVEIAARDRRGGLRMPAAAERRRDRRGVDRLRPAPDDDEDALVHLDEQDERPRVGEVDDLVGEVRDPVDVCRPAHRGDQNLLALRVDRLQRVEQRDSGARARPRRAACAGTRSRGPGARRGGSTTTSASTSRWVVVAYVSDPVSSWIPSAKTVASSGVGRAPARRRSRRASS